MTIQILESGHLAMLAAQARGMLFARNSAIFGCAKIELLEPKA